MGGTPKLSENDRVAQGEIVKALRAAWLVSREEAKHVALSLTSNEHMAEAEALFDEQWPAPTQGDA